MSTSKGPATHNDCDIQSCSRDKEDISEPEKIYYKTPEKGREKEERREELEETKLTKGDLRVPVINSPADIYRHFSSREEESCEERDSSSEKSNTSDSEDWFTEDNEESLFSTTRGASTSKYSNTTGKMFSPATSEEVANGLIHSYQQTLNNLVEKLLIEDVNIEKFQGKDNENITRWYAKLELLLERKGIKKSDSVARAHVINNLTGPAETFLFELRTEERNNYERLKSALMKRYATKDRIWVKRQRLISRRQGENEVLSDYINDMHELFSGLQIAEEGKVTYFTEGLLPPLKVKVLERMPGTLLEAEEIARTFDFISQRVWQSNESDQVERLINALMVRDKESAMMAGTGHQAENKELQTIKTQIDDLARKLDSVLKTGSKPEVVSANADSGRGELRRMTSLMEKWKDDILSEICQMEQRIDAQITERFRRDQRFNLRPRIRRPICFNCGIPGHYQNSCRESEYNDSRYTEQPAEQRSRYQEIPSQSATNQPNSIAAIATDQIEAQSQYYGSRLARRTGTPVGPEPRLRVGYLNAFNATGRMVPKGTFGRPNSMHQMHPNQKLHHHVPLPRHQLSKLQVKQQEKSHLSEPTKEVLNKIPVTVLRPTEGGKEEVKRKVTIANKDQPPSGQVPQPEQPFHHKDSRNDSYKQMPANETTEELKVSKVITICGSLEGQLVDFLVDSGACSSVITEKFTQQMYGDQYPAKVSDGVLQSIHTISGDDVPLLGKIDTQVKFDGVLYPIQFHVTKNLPCEAILGRDFLHQHDAVIDLKNNYLNLGDQSLKLKRKPDYSGTGTYIYAFWPSNDAVRPTFFSTTQTYSGDSKKSQTKLFPGNRTTLQSRSKSGNWKSSIWMLALIVLYMYVASGGQSLGKVQPTYKSIGNRPCYSRQTDQVSFRTTKKSSISSREHDSISLAKTYAHNWNHPNISTRIECKCHPLPTSQPKMLTQKIFKWRKDEKLQEITTIRSRESTVKQNLRCMNSWHCNTLSSVMEYFDMAGEPPSRHQNEGTFQDLKQASNKFYGII